LQKNPSTLQELSTASTTQATESMAEISNNNAFSDFCYWYSMNLHGPLSACICLFGICSNIINATVLTRRHLFSPVSLLLTSLAIADCIKMGGYLIYSIHFTNHPVEWPLTHTERHSYICILVFIIQQNIGICMHFYAILIAVSMATFRSIII